METLSDFVYVYPVKYDGLSNGEEISYTWTIEEDLNEYIQGSSKLPGGYSYRTSGYIDGEEMYREIITSNRDDYRYEVSEGLKQFGN